MAIENPTKYVSVRRLDRFKRQLDSILDDKATRQELTEATIIPVDLESMTTSSTFVKNNILFINGVGYRATKDTAHLPVVLQVQDGHFVVDYEDGAPAFVVSDYTLDEDWEVWGDASVKRTLGQMQESLDESLDQMEHDMEAFISEAQVIVQGSIKPTDIIENTAGTKQYTVQQLLTAMADLMDKAVVADSIE